MSVDPNDILEYLDRKRNSLFDDNDQIDFRVSNVPEEATKKSQIDTMTDNILGKLQDSPLAQLGEDFIAEQTSKVGNQLLTNAQGIVQDELEAVKSTAEKAVNLAFSTITAAMTAQNNIIMFFIQQVAQQILDSLDDKETTRVEMIEATRQLHNALAQLVAGDPFFAQYLSQLREALIILFTAQNNIVQLRNTYQVTDIFRVQLYDSILNQLNSALALLEPEGNQTDKPFTDEGLFANIGIPSESQQLTLLLSIPKLAKDLILATKGYFLHVAKINGLLIAYFEGLDALTSTGSDKLKNYTIGMLDSVHSRTSSLTQKMAISLNGGGSAFNTPVTGYEPEPVKVSAAALGWNLEVQTIIAQLELLPKESLKDFNLDKTAIDNYNESVEKIKALTTLRKGSSVLVVNEGQEQIGLMETQITQFTLAALGAIVSGEIAEDVLPLGRATIGALELSRENDTKIREALLPFVSSELPFFNTLNRIGNDIYGLLDRLGLDKASDLLKGGRFQDFFALNARTATYAGTALAVLSELKQCVNTTENADNLERAEREIKKDVKNQELLMQRSASSSLERQKSDNTENINKLDRIRSDVKNSPSDCIVDDKGNFNGDALVERFGSVLGVNLLADAFGSSKLQNLAKGRLF